MVARRGLSVLDLLPQTSTAAGFVPDDVVERLGVLTVLEHRATTSDDFFLHEGTLQSLADALDLDTTDYVVRVPGLTHGLPFRLALRRGAPQASGQEGPPGAWAIDIQVSNVEVRIPGLQAAKQVGGEGLAPLRLERVGDAADERSRRVFLVARGVLRVSGAPGEPAQVQLADAPDPFDPTAPTGAVIRLTARPPHFFWGSSEWGTTLDSFVIDLSEMFTPAEVVARGHDERWRGLAFKEATVYFPKNTPLLPNLSVSARDVIVGDPGGLQGELRLEFGADFADQFNTHIQVFRQQPGEDDVEVAETTPGERGTSLQFGVELDSQGLPRRVRAEFGVGDPIPGHTDVGIVGVWWRMPTGEEGNEASTEWFDAPTDGVLRYRLRVGDPGASFSTPQQASAVPEGQTELQEVRVSFPRIGATAPATAPLIDAVIGGATFHNVVHLRGPRERLAGTVLRARGNAAGSWAIGTGSAPSNSSQTAELTLPLLPDTTTRTDVVYRNAGGPRRVRIEVVRTGPLAVGSQSGAGADDPGVVTVVSTGVATPTAVLDTFLAAPFHGGGSGPAAAVGATISGTQVTVPRGTIAEVEVPVPVGASDPLPAPLPTVTERQTAVQVLFQFAIGNPPNTVVYPATVDAANADPDRPKHVDMARVVALAQGTRLGPAGDNVRQKLQSWTASLGTATGRKFVVVARTDDLKLNGTLAQNKAFNDTLAGQRRDVVVAELRALGVPQTDILARIETAAVPAGIPAGATVPGRMLHVGRLALPPSEVTPTSSTSRPVWNRNWTADGDDSDEHTLAAADRNRTYYRCVEIVAVDPSTPPAPPTPPPTDTGVPTSMLVPGKDGAPPPPVASTETEPPPIDYRVRLRLRWDSPTVVELADAIPTEAEALVAWKRSQVELPSSGGAPGQTLPEPTGPDFWEVVLHWTYDVRTSQTEVTGSLSLPDGTVTWRSDALAGALAFGPAFMALVPPGDVLEDDFARAAVILLIGAAVGELLNGTDGPEGSVDIDKLTIAYRWNGTSRVAATVDYTVDLRVNVGLGSAGTLAGRIKLRYKGVGVRFDGGEGLDSIGITYDDVSVEVVDPGTWSLGGPLGNLIRVAASRIGNGSTWMELDLELALDLGVVRLEGATIRITLDPFGVELRGLTAVINVPGVIEGKGAVTVGEAGAIRALLGLQVIPARLGAYGALAVDGDFVAVEVGVQLPVGIPLANTGLGLFGLMGRFVANGTRDLTGLTNPDPVQRELDWYARSPQLKYARLSGQYALGLGAVIGTLPDGGFTFNAEGTLALGFPDVSVMFGINARLLSERKEIATESGTTPTGGLRIIGLTLFEPDALMVAVRASYLVPKVFSLEVPVSAFFPLQGGTEGWFVRIGTDNHPDRPGSPATVVLLPDLLDRRAWAFVLVEERQLHGLGGTLVPPDMLPALDFDGFSVGVGAGFDVRWSAGPFKLEIIAFLLVGVGTKPLLFAGAAGVRGELDLVLVSVGVEGLVHFHVSPGLSYVEGHFCGSVDFFFFSVEGCVDFRIGDDPPTDIPQPPSPLLGVDLCDHLAAVKGQASASAMGNVPTVWPDTVAVLKFAHYVEDGLGTSSAFRRVVAPTAALSAWSGSTELKYAFRLTAVDLFRLTPGADPALDASWTPVPGPIGAAWWLPTHRRAAVVGGDEPGPSTEEGRELGLFHWDPRAWSRWLGEGSQQLPGDPANTVGVACDEPRPAEPSCAYGQDARFSLGALAAFDATPGPGAVFPSRYTVLARAGGGFDPAVVAGLASDAGWTFAPGAVRPLHGAVVWEGKTLERGWRLPSLREAGAFVCSLPTVFAVTKPLLRGDIVLEVCFDRRTASPDPSGTCDTMPTQQGPTTAFGGASGAKYTSKEPMNVTTFGGEPAVVLQPSGMRGDFPGQATAVRVDLSPGGTVVEVTAFRGKEVVGRAVSFGEARQVVSVAGPAIDAVTIVGKGPGGKPTVIEVCWGTGTEPLADIVAGFKDGKHPTVTAFDTQGHALELKAEAVTTVRPGDDREKCVKLVFRLPSPGRRDPRTVPGWARVEVGPWRAGEVALVAACGVTLEAAQASAADGDFRDSLTDVLVDLVGHLGTNDPTHAVYLDPETTYQLRVRWQYQGFRPDEPGDEPAPPDPGAWIAVMQPDRYTFRTAAFGRVAAPAPAATSSLETDPAQGGPGYDERVFDPRGLARFITAAVPDVEDPPHFLDDRVGFWFLADHLEPLVEKYTRILQAKVLRTDPPSGSLHGVPNHQPGAQHVLDVTLATHFTLETLTWFEADHRFVEAAAAAPCVGTAPPVGSSSISVDADLVPGAEYDLALQTVPQVVGAHPEVTVARTHFRASRYRNPAGLLDALGFGSPEALTPPTDAIATGAFEAGPLEVSDVVLDEALVALGLDPWPLPAGPRTTVIWAPRPAAGSPWRVAGALLEADEPVFRPGFRTGAIGEAPPPPRLDAPEIVLRRRALRRPPVVRQPLLPRPPLPPPVEVEETLGLLVQRVRNAAGTRLLFVPSAPIALSGGLQYGLRLVLRENGVPGSTGGAPLFDRPSVVFQEGA